MQAGQPKPSKYGNERTTLADGTRCASRREARRLQQLRVMERAGLIRGLRDQVRYSIEINGHHVCDYIADAVYETRVSGVWREVTEDSKGPLAHR